MKTNFRSSSILGILILFLFIQFQGVAQNLTNKKVVGIWSGELDLPNGKLEVIFKITSSEQGKLAAKMDVPLQGAKDIQVDEVTVKNDSLVLTVKMILGNFAGTFKNDSSIEGKWSQGGVQMPLTLAKTEKTTEIKRPQTPKEPFPFLSKEVEYLNRESGLKLAGTLTIPTNAQNCPAVILISGPGAQDRDEMIFEHRPFLVIADFLTRNGIAVLRVDDRGVGGSEGDIRIATSEDFAGDVLAGLEFLKLQPEIDHSQIGLIGHSEGGLIAPIVANKTNEIAFLVLLGGPGIIGEQILYKQGELINKAAGMTDEQANQNRKLQETIFDIILNEKDSAKQLERLQKSYTNGMYSMLNEDQKKAINTQIKAVNTAWFKYFLTYDPYPALTKVRCPVLALNGEKDLQVPAKVNLAAIEKALTEGGNKNVKTIEFENLNHLFQHCKTGAISEYAQIEETFSPEVLEIINEWIWEVLPN